MADGTRTHRVSISVDDKTVEQWTEYEINTSMVEPADSFSMTRPLTLAAWKLCRKDARIQVAIDGVVRVDGFIDDRVANAKANTLQIQGRCKVGRLVQTSIGAISGFDGLSLVDAVKKLAAPEFSKVTLSNARNRNVSRGKGGRAPAGGEPAVFNVKGKLDEDHAGRLDPGEMRWNVVEQLCSSVQLGCWSTGDGRELIVGQPNYNQEPQFMLKHTRVGRSTVKDMTLSESVKDRYAMIESFGTGKGGDDDYGAGVISHKGNAFEGPNADGTGHDFQFPKRLCKSQSALQSNAEAGRDAVREMIRRNFNRQKFSVEMPLHGQQFRSTIATLFACDTLARVIWEEPDGILFDGVALIYEANFKADLKGGEVTTLGLVPRGTVFVA